MNNNYDLGNLLDSYNEIQQGICTIFGLTDDGLGGNISDCRDDNWLIRDNHIIVGYGLTSSNMDLFPSLGNIFKISLSEDCHYVAILVENIGNEMELMIFDRSKCLGGCDYLFNN